jgi:hypothetical protein
MRPVHLGLMLVGVVDEDCVKIVRFGPTLLLYGKFNGPFCDTSHERDWLLTCTTLIASLGVYR